MAGALAGSRYVGEAGRVDAGDGEGAMPPPPPPVHPFPTTGHPMTSVTLPVTLSEQGVLAISTRYSYPTTYHYRVSITRSHSTTTCISTPPHVATTGGSVQLANTHVRVPGKGGVPSLQHSPNRSPTAPIHHTTYASFTNAADHPSATSSPSKAYGSAFASGSPSRAVRVSKGPLSWCVIGYGSLGKEDVWVVRVDPWNCGI